jgi:hypothetical protein
MFRESKENIVGAGQTPVCILEYIGNAFADGGQPMRFPAQKESERDRAWLAAEECAMRLRHDPTARREAREKWRLIRRPGLQAKAADGCGESNARQAEG